MTDRHRVGHGAEAEHDFRRARPREVGRAEVAAHRVDLRLLPGVLVEGLERRVGGRLDAELDGAHRQQGVAQLGAGHAQDADVDRIDGVDAALDEGALAPVDHLPAAADFPGARPGLEAPPQEGVAELRAGADAVLRLVGQRRAGPVAVLVGEVVEGEAADKAAHRLLVAELELARDLRGVREQPLLVVLVAVVAVDRERRAAGGDADDALVGVGDPEPEAIRERIAPAPLEFGRRLVGRRGGLVGGLRGRLAGGCRGQPANQDREHDGGKAHRLARAGCRRDERWHGAPRVSEFSSGVRLLIGPPGGRRQPDQSGRGTAGKPNGHCSRVGRLGVPPVSLSRKTRTGRDGDDATRVRPAGYLPIGVSSTRRKCISPPSDCSPIRPGSTRAPRASFTFFPLTKTTSDGPSSVIS